MGIRTMKCKMVVGVVLMVVLWWLVLRRLPKSAHSTCEQMFAGVRKHIVKDAFDYRDESFVGLWASTNVHEKETCSYYTFHKRLQKMMMGYKKPDGVHSSQYVDYAKGDDGVITYFAENDPTNILGYIYPIFFDSYGPGLGNIECTDKNGFAEWKATIAAPMQLLPQFTEDIIKNGIETFKAIGPQLDVDIHLGNFYEKKCWNSPSWNRLPKNN